MKKGIGYLLSVMMMLAVCLSFCGCEDYNVPPPPISQMEQNAMKQQQETLFQRQPPPKIDFSCERDNIARRHTRWNNQNKISFIYLYFDNGVLHSFHSIKGKVSSLNSFMTPMETIVRDHLYCNQWSGLALQSPDIDGSYGENVNGIFFFTTDDVYCEWRGAYFLCDQPLKITQKPLVVSVETENLPTSKPSVPAVEATESPVRKILK